MKTKLKNAAIRVLAEQRESRSLKAGHMRRQFGERLSESKALSAEVEQMETEVEAIDAAIALIEDTETTED